MTEETDWLPSDPPIETVCDGCNRGIPEYFYREKYAYMAHIYDVQQDKLSSKWTFCSDCFDEIYAFVESTLELTGLRRAEQEFCGFCGDELDESKWDFAFSPTCWEDWDNTHLCSNCQTVMTKFIKGVPEEEPSGPDPAGEVWYPSELATSPVQSHTDDVDDGAVVNVFSDIDEGDVVYFEAHSAPYDGFPAEFVSGTGVTVDVQNDPLAEPLIQLDLTEEPDGFWIVNGTPIGFQLRQFIPTFNEGSGHISGTTLIDVDRKVRNEYRFGGRVISLEIQ